MLEPEIHYAVRDGLAVLVLHQVLIVTAYISEEGLAELEVLRMIIDVEIFLDWKELLGVLGQALKNLGWISYPHFRLDDDLQTWDAGWNLEFHDEVLIIWQLDRLNNFWDSDLVNFVDCLERDFGVLQEP